MTKKEKCKGLNRINNKGLSLIELIVTVAILAVAATLFVSSYTGTMEDQTMQADMVALNNIDTTLQEIFIYDEVFDDVENYAKDQNQLVITFAVEKNDDGYGVVRINDAAVSDSVKTDTALTGFPDLYKYLKNYVGDEIVLTSTNYKNGYYKVHVTFSRDIRGGGIDNDSVIISNSGDSYLY